MGRAIAKLFAEEGARVVAIDMNGDSVEAVASEIKASGGEAVGVSGNVTKQENIDKMVETATSTFGSLDILVNNAGIMDNFLTVGEVTDEMWDRVIAVNLTGPMKLARAAINIMDKQETGGVIINNASVGGLFGTRGGASYVASKHALIGLTKKYRRHVRYVQQDSGQRHRTGRGQYEYRRHHHRAERARDAGHPRGRGCPDG